MPIPAPDPDKLPPGPQRDLVVAIHRLYDASGRPGSRRIAEGIRGNKLLRDSVSHQTVSLLLHGRVIPSWSKVECLVSLLAQWAVHRPHIDGEIATMHELWLAATDGVPANIIRESEPLDPVAPGSHLVPSNEDLAGPPAIKKDLSQLLAELSDDRSYVKRKKWEDLDFSSRVEFVRLVVDEMRLDRNAMAALRTVQNINSFLTREMRMQVAEQIAHLLRTHSGPAVRAQAAWDLRLMWDVHNRAFLWDVLVEVMSDSDLKVADYASGSLAFLIDDSISEELWNTIDDQISSMYDSPDVVLVDAALFFYYKLLEKGSVLPDITAVERRLRASIRDDRIEVKERALFVLPELLPRLQVENCLAWVRETTEYAPAADSRIQAKILYSWRMILLSPNRSGYRSNKLSDDVATDIAKMLTPRILQSTQSDYGHVRENAWCTLREAGASLPRTQHQAVIDEVTSIARSDRGIDVKHLKAVVDNFVGLVPDELQEIIAQKEREGERLLEE